MRPGKGQQHPSRWAEDSGRREAEKVGGGARCAAHIQLSSPLPAALTQHNYGCCRTNYFVFFLATMALSFLTQPRALLWTGALLAAWVYLFLIRTAPLVIGGREYSEREKALGLGLLSFVVVFFLSPVGATALYGASLSACLIAVHASFREPDDLFLDDPGPAHLFGNGGAPMGSVFAGLSSQPASSGAGAIV